MFLKRTRLVRWLLAMWIVALTAYNFFLAAATKREQQQQLQQLLLRQEPPAILRHLHNPLPSHKLLQQQQQQQQQRTSLHINDASTPKIRLMQSSLMNSISNRTSNDDNDDDTVCLSTSCLLEQGRRLARAFPQRPKETWCIQHQKHPPVNDAITIRRRRGSNSMNDDGHWQGLLLVKVPKAASSTTAGVTLRMAHQPHSCDTTAVQWQHVEGIHYANRSQSTSFLMAPVRNPASRAFSSTWFFVLAPLNITDTDENVIRALNTRRGGGKTKGKGGYQFNYLSLEPIPARSFWSPENPTRVMNASVVHAKVQALVQGYDFLIVVERMEESLTALALLTGLHLGDVLTPSSSKVAGDYRLQRVGRKKGQCHYQHKGKMSPGVQHYVNSEEWRAMNYADEILYRAANASLDWTIAKVIGRDRFHVALAEYRRLQKKASHHCGQRLGSGCTAEGQVIVETTTTTMLAGHHPAEQCYDRDFGCGYQCLDDFLVQERKLVLDQHGHAEIAPGVMI